MTLLVTMLTATTAWADIAVSLRQDGSEYYVKMPITGTYTLTLNDASVTTFKVYDDGGKDEDYHGNCDGTLVLTAPSGYVLQLSGSITTQDSWDYLTVYDNSAASGTKLLDAVSSTSDGTQTAITTVVSSGQSMRLYFYSSKNTNYAGLDLTVTLVSTSAKLGISVSNATGGSVAASVGNVSATTAKVNDMVTLTATPESGYMLSSISVTDYYSNAVAVTGGWYTNNQATFTMPGSAVTVTPTFTDTWTAAGGLYINMPATGTQTATIPSDVTSFKVYDDGGASGDYSYKCEGTLVLTAPSGCVFQLSGSITTQDSWDYLTVYDNSEASGTKLLNAVRSTSNGSQTAITTVTSSGQNMTLYFKSDDSFNYAGLDLTVTLVDTNAEYNISGLGTVTGGSVAATVGNASATKAKVNDVVTLTVTPSEGYLLSDLSVTDASGNPVPLAWDGPFFNTATFTMLGSTVTVTPTFTDTWTAAGGLYINMPATDTKTFAIPAGVQSFMVYDNGGKDGNYSNNCDGTLVLTAPEDYVLQLSGSITTEQPEPNGTARDKLTVYDGTDNNATQLLGEVSSTSNGTQTAITTVTSSGQSMTLYFSSSNSYNYAGLYLTVEVVSTKTMQFPTASGGSGTSKDPYKISSTADLDKLAADVNSGTKYVGVYFELTADITYDGTENNYTPIGQDNGFSGSFDGKGHSISGINFTGDESNLGIFGTINNDAVVKNLTLSDSQFTGTGNIGGISCANSGTITNCHVTSSVTITSGSYVGGIAAYNYGTISYCVSSVTLKEKGSLSSYAYAGGITGAQYIIEVGSGGVFNCLAIGVHMPKSHGDWVNGFHDIISCPYDYYNTSGTNPVENCYFYNCVVGTEDAHNATILSETASVPADLTGHAVTFREFTGGKASTVCLPFTHTAGSEGLYYSFQGVSYDEGEGKWKAVMQQETTLAANTPYLFVPAGSEAHQPVLFHGDAATSIAAGSQTTVGDWTFKGVYEEKTWTAGEVGTDYGFAATGGTATDGVTAVSAGDFVKIGAGAHIKPMRSYLTYTGSGNPWVASAPAMNRAPSELPGSISVVLVEADGSTTTVGTIRMERNAEGWYSLDGLHLDSKPTTKGLYIHNGRKEVVK